MSDPVFLGDLTGAVVGGELRLDGDEGRHASVVRRIRAGERILITDGAGRAAAGVVESADKTGVTMRVENLLDAAERAVRFVVVHGLPKADRGERAVEMLTELGVDEIIPWQASRAIVRWQGERGEKSRLKWQSTAREATKQSRQLRVPQVSELLTTKQLCARLADADAAIVLHEAATDPISGVDLPSSGEVIIVVGPEGGISREELTAFEAAGGRPVLMGDTVLRTSTAGVVGLAQLQLLAALRSARG